MANGRKEMKEDVLKKLLLLWFVCFCC